MKVVNGFSGILLLFLALSCTSRMTSSQVEAETPAVPKNVILMIGDGMGLTQITAGMIANNNFLNLERCAFTGLAKTSSSDKLITDSAAGATALASGIKTYNGAIGVDDNKTSVPTLLEIAAENNLSTGVIASSSITHATPASFYAHQPSRNMYEEIAADLVASDVDIFMGGGRINFNQREDKRDLMEELTSKGFSIYHDLAEVKEDNTGKIGVFIADNQPVAYTEGRGDFLPQATERTLNFLQNDKDGFFLIVEGAQIDWRGHGNESDGIIAEMIDFDNAIGKALDFAEKDGETLVIITADHETGGYAITGGDKETGKVEGSFSTGGHTAVMVPVFAHGPGAEAFTGIYENNEVFHKVMKNWLIVQ